MREGTGRGRGQRSGGRARPRAHAHTPPPLPPPPHTGTRGAGRRRSREAQQGLYCGGAGRRSGRVQHQQLVHVRVQPVAALEGGQQPRALPEGRVVRQRQAPPRLGGGRISPSPAGGAESAGRWNEAVTVGPGPPPAARRLFSPRSNSKPCDCTSCGGARSLSPCLLLCVGLRLSVHQVPSLLSTETESDTPVRPQRSAHAWHTPRTQ